MEILFEIFKAIMCVAGIFFFLLIIFSIVDTVIKNIKLNKIHNKFSKKLDNIIAEKLSKEETTEKRGKPNKKDIQK